MPSPDWASAPFARIYATLPRDHPTVWTDDHLLAWYVRLLLPADRAWPVTLEWPRRIPDETRADLIQLGAVDDLGDEYQIHGLDGLHRAEDRRNRAGGLARAHSGGRDAGTGRWTSTAGDPRSNAGDQPVVRNGGDQPVVPTGGPPTNERTNGGEDPLKGSSPPPTVDTSARGAPEPNDRFVDPKGTDPLRPSTTAEYRRLLADRGPDDAPCDEPELHQLHHRWYAGVGWRCLLCEHTDSRTLRDRAKWTPPPKAANPEEAPDDRPF